MREGSACCCLGRGRRAAARLRIYSSLYAHTHTALIPLTLSSPPASLLSAPSVRRLPDTYLLVQRPDAIRLLYVLLYADRPAAARRVNWCTALVALYAALLVAKALYAVFGGPARYY